MRQVKTRSLQLWKVIFEKVAWKSQSEITEVEADTRKQITVGLFTQKMCMDPS